ncbi:MAG TPA: hypothetical protein VK183_00520 [Flavobacterium sp.]|nr:hypothetical protein [Flavobacterium sp.]
MKTLFQLILAVFLFGIFPAYAQGDSIPGVVRTIQKSVTWLGDHHFMVRKTFDGAKDEAKPATATWNKDYENDRFYSIVDVAVKLYEFPVIERDVDLLFYPKIEFHENTIPDESKRKNTLSGGINTELLCNLGSAWYTHPFVTGSFDYKTDRIKEIETIQAKSFLSFSGSKAGEPGAQIKDGTDALIFRYYPYSGFEYYQVTEGSGKRASMWVNRLYFDFFPFSRYHYTFVQLSFDYSYRSIIRDDLYAQGNVDWLAVSLIFFPDGKGNFGIGIDYSVGEDPSANFVKTDVLALGVKLKI